MKFGCAADAQDDGIKRGRPVSLANSKTSKGALQVFTSSAISLRPGAIHAGMNRMHIYQKNPFDAYSRKKLSPGT
jgi:hypothetical protein